MWCEFGHVTIYLFLLRKKDRFLFRKKETLILHRVVAAAEGWGINERVYRLLPKNCSRKGQHLALTALFVCEFAREVFGGA
jgi:hypothetical protein